MSTKPNQAWLFVTFSPGACQPATLPVALPASRKRRKTLPSAPTQVHMGNVGSYRYWAKYGQLPMRWMAAILLFLPMAALAQTNAPSANSNSLPVVQPQASPEATSQPARPQTCDDFYPKELATGTTGTTVLNVHVLKDGTLTNISLLTSSGHNELDQAAIKCASVTKRAQMSNGQPVEVDWQATVHWFANWHSFVGVPDIKPCPANIFPPAAIRGGEKGQIKLSYVIGSDGNVVNTNVIQSSGYSDLDDAAISCVKGRHFPAATRDGTPVTIDKTSSINFDLRG